MGSDKGVVCFGEIMLRLSPPGHERFAQARSYDACFGGGEANVAVSLAQFGVGSRFVTALPAGDVGQACLNTLRGWGVDTTRILRSDARMGLYFIETGASQRPSNVIYDRAGSAFSRIDPEWLDWDEILKGAGWFHFTGITPALSAGAAQAVAEGAAAARRLGLTVSCDLNYRKKLWTREQARKTMSGLMANVDVCIANEEDAESVFGIAGGDVVRGALDSDRYVEVATELAMRFGFKAVAITLRESLSASRNRWSGLLLQDGKSVTSRRYEINVVDRVGSGDAFAAGLIYGMQQGFEPQRTIEFAAAAGCLKHSVPGDFNISSVAEVESLAGGGGSGRVHR